MGVIARCDCVDVFVALIPTNAGFELFDCSRRALQILRKMATSEKESAGYIK